MKNAFMVFAALVLCSNVFSNGMFLVDQGGTGTAKTGIAISSVSDGSALYYNPARLTYTQGINFEATLATTFPNLSYSSEDGTMYDASKKILPSGSVFLTIPVSSKIVFSAGLTTPHFMDNSWEQSYPGKYIASRYKMLTNAVSLGAGFKVSEKFRLGFAYDMYRSQMIYNRTIPYPVSDILGGSGEVIDIMEISSLVDDSTTASGFTAGISFDLTRKITFALNYKSAVDMEYDNINVSYTQLQFQDIPNAVESFNQRFSGTDTLSTVFQIPAYLGIGFNYKPTNRWIIEFNYSTLMFSDNSPQNFILHTDTNSLQTEYSNTITFSDDMDIIGMSLEYQATKEIRIMGGLKHGSAIIKATDVTPNNITSKMFWISLGVSYLKKGTGFEFSLFAKSYYDQAVFNQEYNFTLTSPDTGYVIPDSGEGLYDLNNLGLSLTYKKRF